MHVDNVARMEETNTPYKEKLLSREGHLTFSAFDAYGDIVRQKSWIQAYGGKA